jgi:hypothetical protein
MAFARVAGMLESGAAGDVRREPRPLPADGARRSPHPPGGPALRDRTAALLPPCFFASAVGFFVAALLLLPIVLPDVIEHFYQARVLALTHMVALGWISMAMCGVLYRYVPGLTKGRLPAPRVAVAQWVTFLAGVLGLVTHFWLGRWTGTAVAAALLLISAVLLCANLWPLLLGSPARGVAEIGVLGASGFLVVAATLGTAIAVDKQWPLLRGSTVTNLGAHAHLAALGWVGLTICALSFRFLPAFLLPAVQFPRAARAQVGGLATATVLLATALLARSALVPVAALGVGALLVAYLVLLGRMAASRRMPIDWSARHALASAVWCMLAVAGGVTLAVVGTDTAPGARLAAAYGMAGLLGWMSNLVIGMSYKLFPGFVIAARNELGRAAVPLASVSVPDGVQPVVFVAFNAGIVGATSGVIGNVAALALAGGMLLAAAGCLYGAATVRTLGFTLRDPRRPSGGLAVLP